MTPPPEVEPSSILCWEVVDTAEGQVDEWDDSHLQTVCCGRWDRDGACGVACLCCACPCTWPTFLAGAFWFYHLLVGVETGIVLLLIISYPVTSRFRLILIAVQLILQCLANAAVLEDVWRAARFRRGSRHWTLSRPLHYTKLELMVIAAFLTALACISEVLLQMVNAPETMGKYESNRFSITISMCIYHIVAVCVLAVASCRLSGVPRRNAVSAPSLSSTPPTVIKACEFAAVPEAERTGGICCSICLVDFDGGDAVLPLPCRHVFHAKCLGQWLLRSTTCPLRCKNTKFSLPVAGPGGHCFGLSRKSPAPGASAVSVSFPEPGADADRSGQEEGDGSVAV
eukprot:CAMPEP_0175232650 /NCGR_PEP_ID=MMETSP0093-20121207/26071_1 /TAXON_ID=311494 /ORGANISM="Alexandrium monilatum, Strain CCMP3105" /LENGTH=341 /DNA_ID=CAMNT_0016526519 /DNA_START=43 /DNA_END=1068 /DNA_ORIENTATION=-